MKPQASELWILQKHPRQMPARTAPPAAQPVLVEPALHLRPLLLGELAQL